MGIFNDILQEFNKTKKEMLCSLFNEAITLPIFKKKRILKVPSVN